MSGVEFDQVYLSFLISITKATLKIDRKIRNLQQGLIGFESFLIKGELPLQISTMLPGTSLSEKDRSEIFLFGRSCAKNKIKIILLTMSKRRTATHVRKHSFSLGSC